QAARCPREGSKVTASLVARGHLAQQRAGLGVLPGHLRAPRKLVHDRQPASGIAIPAVKRDPQCPGGARVVAGLEQRGRGVQPRGPAPPPGGLAPVVGGLAGPRIRHAPALVMTQACQGLASYTRLNGVCAARRNTENPAPSTSERIAASPACAPS